jgi:serine/threonine protein kinase
MAIDLSGKIIADKYRLDSVMVSGPVSVLYRATHRLMDKAFAVKLLRGSLSADESEVDAFFAAAKSEAAISHTGIPSIVDFGRDRDGTVYCVYHALPEDSLKQLIASDGAFPPHTAIDVGEQIASALAAAHEGGIVHGNLTADRVLLSNTLEGGIRAHLIDFGSPNPIMNEGSIEQPEDYAYLAPEQCAGSDTPTVKTDIYAVGVILYEMLAGVPPFTGEKPTDVMIRHIEEMPAPLSSFRIDVPDGIEAVILKALAKDPELRYESAEELAGELHELKAGTPKALAAGARGKGFWTTAIMMVVGIGLLAGALIYATSVKQTDPVTALQPDANGQPVQPLNPATGQQERNLAAVSAAGLDANSNISMPGVLPGGDGYDPWANARSLQPPGGTVTIDPNSQSPFTMDPGCTMLPSGLVICPTQMPVPTASPTPRTGANTNSAAPSAATPTPRVQPSPARTPAAPAGTPAPPASNRPETEN